MPLLVAAVVNLAAVPIGADQISRSFTPPLALGWGRRSQAPSVELVPLLPEESTAQMIPVVASVPLEVITGVPEVYPSVKLLLAMSVSVGLSLLLTPNLNSRMKSLLPT